MIIFAEKLYSLLFFHVIIEAVFPVLWSLTSLGWRENYRARLVADHSRQVRLRLRVFIGSLNLQEQANHWPFSLPHLHERALGVRIKNDRIKHVLAEKQMDTSFSLSLYLLAQ